MTHRFPIKEIARQTGLGTATIDRVLNNRPNVSPQTKRRVMDAIKELEAQESQVAARGRKLFFDVVVEAPKRFSDEVRKSTLRVLPKLRGAVCRPRFVLQEIMPESEVVHALERIAKRGSHGVILKARDLQPIRHAVDRLSAKKIPIVTLVTDIPNTQRISYVGSNNRGAGETAAYLVATALKNQNGSILVVKSQSSFLGEETRGQSFASALSRLSPNLTILEISGSSGVPYQTAVKLNENISKLKDLKGVYSVGGGNAAIVRTLAAHRLAPEIYVAHDKDAENLNLILEDKLDFILDHSLENDMLHAFNCFLGFHRLIDFAPTNRLSEMQILTKYNLGFR